MLRLRVNGAVLEVAEPPVGRTLAETLRDDLGLTGTKVACSEGHCGACTVQLDGVPVLSCITLVHTVGERTFAIRVKSDAVDYRYAHRDGLSVTMEPIVLPDAIEHASRWCTQSASAR